MTAPLVILGIFVADTAFRAARAPRLGETLIGTSFAQSPGGKGSNQAVAAARLGADVHFLCKLGQDAFADTARATWAAAGVEGHVIQSADSPTGAAFILVEEGSGENAIVLFPGAGATLSAADVEAEAALIAGAAVFMTQLEQPLEAAARGLAIARASGVRTILNPAPAMALPDEVLALCDIVTPNEIEAAMLTGIAVESLDDARRAGEAFLAKGVGQAVITLGARGAVLCTAEDFVHVPAVEAGPVVDTTGAGDAFNGALAVALANSAEMLDAVRYGCATAGLSVTRPGTADSMPSAGEVAALTSRG
ncbi:MAG: ribokinase [Alphaproteobacteria bacterium]|jgi:ribokinase|nr:ribokinase [Alphaproteobacteria bacterium]